MNNNEEAVLKKYIVNNRDDNVYRPGLKYLELTFEFGQRYKKLVSCGQELPSVAENNYAVFQENFVKTLGEKLTIFEMAVKKDKSKANSFPIKDWLHFCNDDENRFVMKDFPKMFAMTVESCIKRKADVFIHALRTVDAEEHSKILGNLSTTDTFFKIIESIERLRPEILVHPKFNPLESAVNEGNPTFLRMALNDYLVRKMIKEGKIKPVKTLGVEGDLIRRLASHYDNVKKRNIIDALKVLSELNLLKKIEGLEGIEFIDQSKYKTLDSIQPADKLSYRDIYLYSINEVPIFVNNNARIVKILEKSMI